VKSRYVNRQSPRVNRLSRYVGRQSPCVNRLSRYVGRQSPCVNRRSQTIGRTARRPFGQRSSFVRTTSLEHGPPALF